MSSSTRIDAPHEMVAEAMEAEAIPAGPIDEGASGEQVRLQALQLADYLRERQKELDAREAKLNARTAGLESDARTARLWFEERQSAVAEAEAALAEERKKSNAQAAALRDREERLAAWHKMLAEQERALLDRQYDFACREKQFEERLERLAAAETARERNEQASAARCTEAQRRADELERLAEERRRATDELDRRRRAVERRAEHVEKSRESLMQLREELGRMHRETLEIRLATEELWVQLSGAAPPAALTRSLGRIRTRLAEQYAQANAEMVERKKELEAIRGQLEAKLDELREHKRRFDKWIAGRQEECDTQASQLIAREEQLEREANHIREEADRWRSERSRFERELKQFRENRIPA